MSTSTCLLGLMWIAVISWQVLWNTVVEEAKPNEKGMLGALTVRNVKSGEVRDVPVHGLFFAIGHEPASRFLQGQVRMSCCHPFAFALPVWLCCLGLVL